MGKRICNNNHSEYRTERHSAPHSKPKRTRRTETEIEYEEVIHHYNFKLAALFPIWVIWTEFQGDEFLKILATAFILVGCFHYYTTKKED